MTAPSDVHYSPSAELIDRLRRFTLIDIIACASGVVTLIAEHIFVHRSAWVVVLAAMVLATGALMATALRPLSRGEVGSAVARLALANWLVAIGATAIATFALPVLLLVTLLPPVLAVPYVTERRLKLMVAVSALVATSVAAVGTLQDFTALSADIPDWVERVVIIVFMPVLLGLIGIVALQNATSLRGALSDALQINQDLRVSQDSVAATAGQLRESRARLVAASDRARRTVERDLHDGAQQLLVATAIRLAIARDKAAKVDPGLSAGLSEIHTQLHLAINELRELAQGLYPQVLSEHGLSAALDSAVHRSALQVVTDLRLSRRHPTEVEAAVYFCCVEALQNAAKHAGAEATIRVAVHDSAAQLDFEISDNGPGFDLTATPWGQGLQNMTDRVGAAGGWVRVDAAPGAGTTVRGSIAADALGKPIVDLR